MNTIVLFVGAVIGIIIAVVIEIMWDKWHR
jgi:hypothetical protein